MEPGWERAIKAGDVDAVRALLRSGADAGARDRQGQTALMLAAHAGRREIVESLIAHGVDLDVTAKFGLSALILAIVAGHPEIARMLARAGADLSRRGTGAPGFAGKTARDLAAERGMHELCAELEPAFFEPDRAEPADPLAAVRRCIEQGSRALLLDSHALSAAFFELRTGVAGELVQKLVNYGVRMAAVVPDLAERPPRFREFAREANAGRQLRFFATRQEAIDWLAAGVTRG